MSGGRGDLPLRDIGGGFLELPIRGLFQAGGRLEANLRHTVGNLNPQERSHLQGRHPIQRCHHTHRRGVLSFLASRQLIPLESCTPATIDFAVKFFHQLNKNWGHRLGCTPSSYKKKVTMKIWSRQSLNMLLFEAVNCKKYNHIILLSIPICLLSIFCVSLLRIVSVPPFHL